MTVVAAKPGDRWIPESMLEDEATERVQCWCGSWLVTEEMVGSACEFCGAPQRRRV